MKKWILLTAGLIFGAAMTMAQVDAQKQMKEDKDVQAVNAVDELTPQQKAAAEDPNIVVKRCAETGNFSYYRQNGDGTLTPLNYDVERKKFVPVLDKEGKEVRITIDAKGTAKKVCKGGGKKACCAKKKKSCSSAAAKKSCKPGCKKSKSSCKKGDKSESTGASATSDSKDSKAYKGCSHSKKSSSESTTPKN